MSSKLSFVVTSALLAGLLAGCGHTAGTVAGDPAFAAADTNGDGRVSYEEANLPKAVFDARDANGDGSLDLIEWMGGSGLADNVARVQAQKDQQRDNTEPHRTGSTVRGAE